MSSISTPWSEFDYTVETRDSLPSSLRGERALWRAVILQALLDAASNSHKPEARFAKQEAIHWLTGNSENFKTVCDHAGENPAYIRRLAREALARQCAWRAPRKDRPAPSVMETKSLGCGLQLAAV